MYPINGAYIRKAFMCHSSEAYSEPSQTSVRLSSKYPSVRVEDRGGKYTDSNLLSTLTFLYFSQIVIIYRNL